MSYVTPEQKDLLREEMGDYWAEIVAENAEEVNKALRSRAIEFKSLPAFDAKQLNAPHILLLGAIKSAFDDVQAMKADTSDNTSRMETLELSISKLADSMKRLTESVAALTGNKIASQSGSTELSDENKQANFLSEMNGKTHDDEGGGSKSVPILSQLKGVQPSPIIPNPNAE